MRSRPHNFLNLFPRYEFPTTCQDNFYKEPDRIRKFALGLDFNNKQGFHPGLRSDELHTIDKNFADQTARKLLSIFGDFEGCKYECSTFFQKIYRFSSDPNDPVNTGWIHTDNETAISAVVYLSPDVGNHSGTSLYIPTRNITPPRSDFSCLNIFGMNDVSNINDIKLFRENIEEHNNQFELTVEVKNAYNRAIVYSGNHFHSQTNYWTPNENDFRLTQVFFFTNLEIYPELSPNCRLDRYDF